jgi:hypothetical protein
VARLTKSLSRTIGRWLVRSTVLCVGTKSNGSLYSFRAATLSCDVMCLTVASFRTLSSTVSLVRTSRAPRSLARSGVALTGPQDLLLERATVLAKRRDEFVAQLNRCPVYSARSPKARSTCLCRALDSSTLGIHDY